MTPTLFAAVADSAATPTPDPFAGLEQLAGKLAGALIPASLVVLAVAVVAASLAERRDWIEFSGIPTILGIAGVGFLAIGGVLAAASDGHTNFSALWHLAQLAVGAVAVAVMVVVAKAAWSCRTPSRPFGTWR